MLPPPMYRSRDGASSGHTTDDTWRKSPLCRSLPMERRGQRACSLRVCLQAGDRQLAVCHSYLSLLCNCRNHLLPAGPVPPPSPPHATCTLSLAPDLSPAVIVIFPPLPALMDELVPPVPPPWRGRAGGGFTVSPTAASAVRGRGAICCAMAVAAAALETTSSAQGVHSARSPHLAGIWTLVYTECPS